MNLSFYLWSSFMVVAAAAFTYFLSHYWRRRADGENTLDWLKLRRAELQKALEAARDDGDRDAEAQLLTDAELRVLDDLSPEELERQAKILTSEGKVHTQPQRRPLFGLLALMLLLLGLPFFLYHRLGAIEDVQIAQSLASLQSADRAEVERLLAQIEARSERRPGNADYLSLLGEYYTAGEQHGKALAVYEQLLELFPESAEVLARAGQAEYLSQGRTLTAQARRRVEAALAVDPNQRTALGTLGMAAFEAEDYDAALRFWERLIAFEVPGTPSFQMMSSVIEEARKRGGVPMKGPEVPSAGVTVTVLAPADADIPTAATIFILARPAKSEQRMPTAVVRRSGADLPLTIRLDDRNAMAGQKISALEEVDIEVQVSPTGQPGRSNASWLATAVNVVPSETASTELTLAPVTP